MSFKGIVRELREMKDGIGSMSRRVGERKLWRRRTLSHIAPDMASTPPTDVIQQGQWANLPPELLLDIIQRVEESETSWPARAVVVFCGSVCKSWRDITREISGPRQSPIQCFIRRNRETSTFYLYCGLAPSEGEKDILLLAAKRIRRATSTEFVISLVSDDFSRASSTYLGKLRSNFLGTKFIVYDSQPPCDAVPKPNNRSSRRFHSKQVSPRVPACNYSVGNISYELNIFCTRGPRRMHCAMHSIPVSSIQEGGTDRSIFMRLN
ncbi:tubby-like F-box protein 5 [Pyrus ussuriensis x Pyrus communis]|uniref:Tubby-like F-box protein 5 n=1 Tax=Pyrus ussuriensis x Pyrus communis TaxID=2448454 RepID=A0A5N5HN26_9ROSA|nr:tubby-like F-box protein 5 [Pyrus ussuriensis x Pyrus communis]